MTMESTGIVSNEIAGHGYRVAWDSIIGMDAEKDRLFAWAALALRKGSFNRIVTAVNRLAMVGGRPERERPRLRVAWLLCYRALSNWGSGLSSSLPTMQ